jgi:hypothetical protein
MTERWPIFEPARLRSVPVQLGLLAATFVGALGLAVVALAVRNVFFESYVRESYAPLSEAPESLLTRLERTATPAKRSEDEEESAQAAPDSKELADWDALFSLWMNPHPDAPSEQRVRRLLWTREEPTLDRVRTTSVVGNRSQRARALELLASVPAARVRNDAIRLCRFVRERARRRGERDLFTRAEQVFRSLSPQS